MSAMSEYYAVTTSEWIKNSTISNVLGLTQSKACHSAKVLAADGKIEVKQIDLDNRYGFLVRRKGAIPLGEGILSMQW